MPATKNNPDQNSLVQRILSILAVYGGETRGIYAAQILANVEEDLGQVVIDRFVLLAGASMGSIITGAAVAGIPMVEIFRLFERESPRIFWEVAIPFRINASATTKVPLLFRNVARCHLPNKLFPRISVKCKIQPGRHFRVCVSTIKGGLSKA